MRPSLPAQSSGRRTEKSPSRNATIASSICRDRASDSERYARNDANSSSNADNGG